MTYKKLQNLIYNIHFTRKYIVTLHYNIIFYIQENLKIGND